MRQEDLKHSITVSRRAWYVRLYTAVYQPSGEITLCKLFWGIALLPIVLVIFALTLPVAWLLDKVGDKPSTPKKKRDREKIVDKTSMFFVKHGTLKKVLLNGVTGFAGLLVLAAAGAVVYLAATYLTVTVVVACVVAAILVTAAIVLVLAKLGFWKKVEDWMLRPIGGVLGHAYYAVKTNTCPRIEVKD